MLAKLALDAQDGKEMEKEIVLVVEVVGYFIQLAIAKERSEKLYRRY
jgi:hypothetical protein